MRKTIRLPGVPTKRSRRKRAVEQLQPDDFDDVRYKVETVRTTIADASDDFDGSYSREELLEVVFVGVVFLFVIGGCVAVGLTSDVLVFSKGALRYVLPILFLPLAWLIALHVWEKYALAPRATSSPPIHRQQRRHSASVSATTPKIATL